MRRVGSRWIATPAALTVLSFSLSCGGGDGTPTEPPPPDPPPAVASVTVTPAESALLVGETVQLAAATLDANGATLTGRTVTWTTADAQVASVGASSGLVTAIGSGSTTITATSEGQSGTATVTVTTPIFAPTDDINLSGTVSFGEVTIPAGVTVTVTDALTINVTGAVSIEGTLAGECVNITINGQSTVTVRGTINNGCTQGQAEAAELTIVGDGDLTIENASFEVGGNVTIKNDPTLTDADFPAANAEFSSPAPAAASSQAGTCRASNVTFLTRPVQAASGADGQTGTDGKDGKTWKLMCRGNAILAGGVRVFGQDGGDGGRGTHEHNTAASAAGGHGGDGGDLKLLATGTWEFTGAGNELIAGDGGIGGFARAEGLQNPNIDPAASALAQSGDGGWGGIVEVRSLVGIAPIAQPGVLTIEVGPGGASGDALAIGAHGVDSDVRPGKPAQVGGSVLALGGFGGNSPDLQFRATGAASTTNVTLTGGDGGDGGKAQMDAGDGGRGDEDFPTGANGGSTTAADEDSNGGDGGDALVKDADGNLIGAGGAGGKLEVTGGNGGFGFDGCGVFPIKNGGDGGDGGRIAGNDGEGGTGKTNGDPGGMEVLEFTGMGGDGGDGEPEVGLGGFKGTDALIPRGPRTNTGRSFEDGEDGEPCGLAFNVGITVKSGGDPNGHEEFIELGTVTMISLRMLTSGTLEFTSGSAPWIKTTGPVAADGSFNTTGVGVAAGISNVSVSFEGEVVLDAEGKVTGINGMLVYDTTNSVLPPQPPPPDGDGQRHPVNYNLTGTVKPPA